MVLAEFLQLVFSLLAAALYGAGVAQIYRMSHGRQKQETATMVTTLILLSILIAMVSKVIGESTARAFSLVGVLSIVRFRTVVEDTRDTAFVIFAVVVGMAAGANWLMVPVVGIPIVGAVAIGLSHLPQFTNAAATGGAANTGTQIQLVVRLGLGQAPEPTIGALLKRDLTDNRLIEIDTARQGAALDYKYQAWLRSPDQMQTLAADLNQTQGVQSIEMRVV